MHSSLPSSLLCICFAALCVAVHMHAVHATQAVHAGNAGQITCFGDSWTAFSCPTLASVVAARGKPNHVVNRGVAGTTATSWANNTEAMILQIAAGGTPSFIWLSIGGNDILDGWAQGICSGNASSASAMACYQRIYNAIDTMLTAIFKVDPFVQVGMFGYDFTNFIGSQECVAMNLEIFKGMSQLEINQIFLAYAKYVLVPLATKYNTLQFQVTPLWGTLQAAGGTQYTPVPYPNIAFPSPYYLMNDGCIHASAQGWNVLMNAFFDSYFASRI